MRNRRGTIDLPILLLEEIVGFRKKTFIQEQSKQYFLLNAFNNMYGRVVIKAYIFHAFRQHVDDVCYKSCRDRAVFLFSKIKILD